MRRRPAPLKARTVRPLSLALLLGLSLAACTGASVPDGGCDDQLPCPSGEVCIAGGSCAISCDPLADGGICPDGGSCVGVGPYCCPGCACPALAVEVCR